MSEQTRNRCRAAEAAVEAAVARQRARVAGLTAAGEDSAAAESTLRVLVATLGCIQQSAVLIGSVAARHSAGRRL
jgi:hypothetical protein